MTASLRPSTHPDARQSRGKRVWVPRQHGAWAMLALPLLLGVAASRPDAWQLILAGAALSAYLGSAALQAWARARRPPAYRAPVLVFGVVGGSLGLVLAIAFPALLLTLVVLIPAGMIVFGGARPGTRRDLANSLAQVAQAMVLVPAAAYVSSDFDPERVLAYGVVAAGYLVGTVLVVRSVLRERGNDRFAALSLAFHLGLLAGAVILFPWPYWLLASALAARAAALPLVQRRWAGGPRPLRPIHVGIVEIVASVAVVVVAFAVPL